MESNEQPGGVALSLGRFEEAPVNGDAELLRQLVMIALDNAIKFTPTGGKVEVTVGRRGAEAVVTIKDNGPGIAAEHMPHLFERFYRGDAARGRSEAPSASASGAGLGLSIAQWIADAHHAKLTVVSNEAQGTAVSVEFPSPQGITPVSSS